MKGHTAGETELTCGSHSVVAPIGGTGSRGTSLPAGGWKVLGTYPEFPSPTIRLPIEVGLLPPRFCRFRIVAGIFFAKYSCPALRTIFHAYVTSPRLFFFPIPPAPPAADGGGPLPPTARRARGGAGLLTRPLTGRHSPYPIRVRRPIGHSRHEAVVVPHLPTGLSFLR